MKIIYTILLILFSSNISAQLFQQDTTAKLKMNISLKGYFNNTSTSQTILGSESFSTTYKTKRIEYNTFTTYIWGRTNEKMTNDDISTGFYVDIRKDRRLYTWLVGQYDKSLSLDIDYRFQSGSGLGFFIVREKGFYINLSNGLICETNSIEQDIFLRNSSRLKFNLKHKNLSLESTTYYQPSLCHNGDIIFKNLNTLDLKINGGLSFQISLMNNYVSVQDKKNLLYTIGFNYQR